MSMNSKRRTYEKQKYEYVEKLDENIFDRYFYDKVNERILLKGKRNSKFKIIKPSSNGNIQIISLINIENKTVTRSYEKLMKILKALFE